MAKDNQASGTPAAEASGLDFIRDIIKADLDAGRVKHSASMQPS